MSVEQGVGDDVVGQAQVHVLVGLITAYIAEHQGLQIGGVVGVGLFERVGDALDLVAADALRDVPAERELEPRQGPHHDRVSVERVVFGVAQRHLHVVPHGDAIGGGRSRSVHDTAVASSSIT
ncbi:MAG: hypothetical protein QOG79_7098 [Mycobacterium sp.]|nr:hypothetical protein [Mycobacterium sp.]MDT5231513.1 hypothetical protein [Mycobacterium sp.]MDT5303715.1 hypothetical protein [Mycobacterium sp.]